MKSPTRLAVPVLLFAAAALQSQPEVEWERVFGGDSNESCSGILQTPDEGFLILATTSSFGAGSSDIWLIKTDFEGNTEWTRTLGGAGGETASCIQHTIDGGYIIAGKTTSFGEFRSNIWLIKLSSEYEMEFDRVHGSNETLTVEYVRQTRDEGYIIAGCKLVDDNTEAFILKTDEDGNIEWNRDFGDFGTDHFHCIEQAEDNGFFVVGKTWSFGQGGSDLWLVKTDSEGSFQWHFLFGADRSDAGWNIQKTDDGGYIIGGYYGTGDFRSALILKIDDEGQYSWNRTFGARGSNRFYSARPTLDNGIIAVEYKDPNSDAVSSNVWIIKTDDQGELLWDIVHGGEAGDWGFYVQQVTDGGYIIAGDSRSFSDGDKDIYLIKTTSDHIPPAPFDLLSPANGDSLDTWEWNFAWEKSIDYNEEDTVSYLLCIGTNFSFQAVAVNDTSITVNSDTLWLLYPEYYEPVEWWVLALSGEDTTECNAHFTFTPVPNEVPEDEFILYPLSFILYEPVPNPFNSTTVTSYELRVASRISLGLYDAQGRLVRSLDNGWRTAGEHRVVFNAEGLPAGEYVIRLMGVDGSQVTRSVSATLIK